MFKLEEYRLNRYNQLSNNNIKFLDFLRGFASLIVLFSHSYQIIIAPVNHSLIGIIGLIAQFSVMVFFVLSGFLISNSISKLLTSTSYSSLPKFFLFSIYFKKRVNRIYPPLIFSLFFTFIIYLIFKFTYNSSGFFLYNYNFVARDGVLLDFQSFIVSFFFLNGFIVNNISSNASLWSLPYEFWYYIILGVVLIFFSRLSFFIGLIILFSLSVFKISFFIYFLVWLSGCIIAIIHNNNRSISTYFFYVFALLLTITFALSCFYILSSFDANHPSDLPGKIIVLFNFFSGLSFSLLLYFLIKRNFSINIPFLINSSHYSYTLYLIHFPVILLYYGFFQEKIHSSSSFILFSYFFVNFFCIIFSRLISKKIEKINIL